VVFGENEMRVHCLQFSKKVLFGFGAAEMVGIEAKELGGKHGLIVTDKIIEKLGYVDKVKKLLQKKGIEVDVFNETKPEPSLEMAERMAEVARAGGYDLVIGLGGGSVLDIAKVASMAVTNPGNVKSFIDSDLVLKPCVPKILIPTTAGTGSEVSKVIVLSLIEEERKATITSPYNFADVAIVDPLMSSSMPPKLTASTGLDALSHAIEAYMSTNANTVTDALALEAVKLIAKNLRIAYAQGENLEARYNVALGSLLAGMAVGAGAGVTAAHAAASAFAVKYKISHGTAVAVALPYIMEYNIVVCVSKLAMVAEAMGEKTSILTKREAATKAIKAVRKIIEDVNSPTKLKDINVPEREIPKLAESMLKRTDLLSSNPRKIRNAIIIFEKMWEGTTEEKPFLL